MLRWKFPPVLTLPATLFIFSVLLMTFIAASSFRWFETRAAAEFRRLHVQIAADLAGQLSRALAVNDDLSALAGLQDARRHFPQLRQAMLFDNQGKILLHTDSGRLGKTTTAPTGPRLTSSETVLRREQGRSLLSVLVPLPEREDGYLQAIFDETRYAREQRTLAVRLGLLILFSSALLAWLARRQQQLQEKARAAKRGDARTAASPGLRPDCSAGLLLAEMPCAALAFGRENRILAANAPALALLNRRGEELETLHVLNAPLPPALLDLYQNALRTPSKPSEIRFAPASHAPALTARVVFAPPTEQWELALVTFR